MSVEKPWEALSYGYRVDKDSPTHLSRTMPIFKLEEKDVKKTPNAVVDGTVEVSSSENTLAEKSAKSMSVGGSYAAFSAAASMSAGHNDTSSVKTFRTDVTIRAVKYSVQATAGLRLKPQAHLEEDVKDYIMESSAEDLADLGEFYVVQADLGGVFKKTYIMEAMETDTESTITAELSATYGVGMVGSVSASARMEMGTRSSNKNAKTKTTWHCEGGDSTKWLGVSSTNVNEVQEAWAKTIVDTNLYPFNFQLKPMWELVGKVDKSKGEELHAYWLKQWRENECPVPTQFAEAEKAPPRIMAQAQKGSYTHFCKWDNWKTGGRWFECGVNDKNGGYNKWNITTHDGDSYAFPVSDILKIANVVEVGDRVVAYFDDRKYCFAGLAAQESANEFEVQFDDGDKKWVSNRKVYKMVAAID